MSKRLAASSLPLGAPRCWIEWRRQRITRRSAGLEGGTAARCAAQPGVWMGRAGLRTNTLPRRAVRCGGSAPRLTSLHALPLSPGHLQSLAREADACGSHLGAGGARGCAFAASAVTFEQLAQEWVIEQGPLGQAGSVLNEYYIRSKASERRAGLWGCCAAGRASSVQTQRGVSHQCSHSWRGLHCIRCLVRHEVSVRQGPTARILPHPGPPFAYAAGAFRCRLSPCLPLPEAVVRCAAAAAVCQGGGWVQHPLGGAADRHFSRAGTRLGPKLTLARVTASTIQQHRAWPLNTLLCAMNSGHAAQPAHVPAQGNRCECMSSTISFKSTLNLLL